MTLLMVALLTSFSPFSYSPPITRMAVLLPDPLELLMSSLPSCSQPGSDLRENGLPRL